MPKLTYRTRADISPQGKPKVYLSIHPADRKAYLDEFVTLLLELQDLSVWYPEDPETARTDDLMEDLSQMQLFLMPVTTRLLTSQDPALTIDFPFAQRKHIPVLPIMMEPGLEDLYAKRCGDLQFLDRNARDDTTLSFREKLEQYLSSVLIGDELAEKIRAAFDAYVFLSYRKKDRKYAQELMRLVHKNDICRDIAIWYDEFLIPGEGFNDAIRAALEKSGLFLLAVTPNLVNEVNYVMTTEYPMAKAAGKPVLPAELVPTDRTALENAYEDLPPCTDARDDDAMYHALMAAVQKLATKENDTSPEHNFFIGLAYLGGVDVEVDHHRALALIRSAAEGGLPEAAQKLVEMYRTGHGVERDYMEAIRWQEHLIEIRYKAYHETLTEETLHNLIWASIHCGDYYRELGKLTDAKTRYANALFYDDSYTEFCKLMIKAGFEITAFDPNNHIKSSDLSFIYDRLGNIEEARGDIGHAIEHYQNSLSIRQSIYAEIRSEQNQHNLVVSFYHLGNIAYLRRELATAQAYYQDALAIISSLANGTQAGEHGLSQSAGYIKLGDIAYIQKHYETATNHYTKALSALLSVSKGSRTTQVLRSLSDIHKRLGQVAEDCGDLDVAERSYAKSLEIDIDLAEKNDTLDALRSISVSYRKLGSIAKTRGHLDVAESFCKNSLQIAASITDAYRCIDHRHHLCMCYLDMGDISHIRKDLDAAGAYFEQAISLLQEEALSENAEIAHTIWNCHLRLGSIAETRGDLETASKHYLDCFFICYTLIANEEIEENQRIFIQTLGKLGDIAFAKHDPDNAQIYYEKYVEIADTLAKSTGTIDAQRSLSEGYRRLGTVAESQGNLVGAQNNYQKHLAIITHLAETSNIQADQLSLCVAYRNLGRLSKVCGDLTSAEDHCRKGLIVARSLSKDSETPEIMDNLAASYFDMALVCSRGKTVRLQEAARLWALLCDTYPGVPQYQDRLTAVNEMLNKSELPASIRKKNSFLSRLFRRS